MCSFATSSARDFNLTMLRYVAASAGLFAPSAPRCDINLNRKASDGPGSFNLDACFEHPAPLDLPERVVEVRK